MTDVRPDPHARLALAAREVDDPTLADLELAVAAAQERLAKALELEADAWQNMQVARETVAAALDAAQTATARYRLLRANPRPTT